MASSELIPRAYQEEIFNWARYENIVAALDTGSGKTYIAALLIRWLATQHSGTRKIYAFIVPRVPLVQQQADFIASQVPLTVRSYHGALVDSWQHDPTRWNQEFSECDVMVMTAQVFLDAMLHAHWSMAQVALLVLDEAHHARKNHPYNQIMRDFYFTCDPEYRPKVFGMTASPIWNPKNAHISLRTLEQNLHSKVLGVLENKDELLKHSPRPTEIIQEYPASRISIPEYPLSLWQRLANLELHSHPVIVSGNLELRYDVTVAEVGPYGADFYLATHLRTLVADLVRKHQYDYMVTQADQTQIVSFDVISVDSRSSDLSSALIQVENILEQFRQSMPFEASDDILPEWLSPKLRVLVSILTERRSSSFQGIVFVEQRQVAATLAWILPRIPALRGWITTGALIGHGTKRGVNSGGQGMEDKKQREILNSFRAGTSNLLISTSVGEEGLDFPACDLIVRYNQLQNMVGYLQSRGRARRFDSTYIVMIPEGSSEEYTRYIELRQSEPEMKRMYQTPRNSEALEMEVEEPDDPMDLAARLHYQIPSTGALLTFNAAISLLSNLCALIPRDKYTPVLQPLFHGDFQMTVALPSALPIPRERLVHYGSVRRTKREAKAAAAFAACKALHELKVFDDYLLPARKTSGADIEDADGRPIPEVGKVSEMMDVSVCDPWSPWHCPWSGEVLSSHAWVYPLSFVGHADAKVGLVTANNLGVMPPLTCKKDRICLGAPIWIDRLSESELNVLQEYTALGIHWCNTSKRIKNPLAAMLALLTSDGGLDIDSMRVAIQNPIRSNGITREDEGHLVLRCQLEFGRPLLLRRLREDLTPLSHVILSDDLTPIGECATYADFYERQNKHRKYPLEIPTDGALLQVETYTRNFDSRYCLREMLLECTEAELPQKTRLVPAKLCESFMFPEHVRRAFYFLPSVIRRVTDVFRARAAVEQLGLPRMEDDLVVEALTLPCATAGFNNQRLETLGDTVLKLCVVVHLFNAYPFRHEGQLDGMRRNSVSNRVLLARAKEVELERFLTSEPSAMRKWRPSAGDGGFIDGIWFAKRKFARRSLQDCMEALLGVGFLCGGIDMALHVGTALQLCFGGINPWPKRYIMPEPTPVPLLFNDLQRALGYEFRSGELLIEAITHPSFQSDSACYQRLEFLGDALLDLVVMEYLYRKYPNATSGQLTWAKSRAVFAPALTTLGIKRLSLDKYILYNNVDLGKALANATPEHANTSYEQIVMEGWKYDPPKALSDVMESVCGAILVDSGYDYERTKAIIERIMEPLLRVLRPDLPRDPTSELMLSLARRSCQRARFEKFASEEQQKQPRNDSVRFIVHNVAIGASLRTTTGGLSRLKPLLAQRVRAQLEDPDSEFYVERLCDCRTKREQDKKRVDEDVVREKLDDEKDEEFAILGLLELHEVDGDLEGSNYEDDDEESMERLEDDNELDVKMVLEVLEHAGSQDIHGVWSEEEDMDIEDVVEKMLLG